MATKADFKKVTVSPSSAIRLTTDEGKSEVLARYALDEIDWPVMPDLLGIVEDYFKQSDFQYKDAISVAEEVSLLTRAYYMQFISFIHKNEQDAYMRRAIEKVHAKMCRVPHPFIDENTKQLLKLKEDNYERTIIKTRKRRSSPKRRQAGR